MRYLQREQTTVLVLRSNTQQIITKRYSQVSLLPRPGLSQYFLIFPYSEINVKSNFGFTCPNNHKQNQTDSPDRLARVVFWHLTQAILCCTCLTRFTKVAVTRDDSQGRFLAQHIVAMLEQCCNCSKQCRNNVSKLCYAKNRRCESSRVTTP